MSKHESITQLVESGEYYKRAFIWHYHRHISPFIHRTVCLVIFIIAIFFAYIAIDISILEFHKKVLPFPIYVENNSNTFTSLEKLQGKRADINQTIARYLLSQYVLYRETYNNSLLDESVWNNLQQHIRAFSSRKVYSYYLDYININNPNSPLLSFSRNARRDITVDKIVFGNTGSEKASVHFTASISGTSTTNTTEYFIAEINYIMTDAKTVAEEHAKFNFLITSYTVYNT